MWIKSRNPRQIRSRLRAISVPPIAKALRQQVSARRFSAARVASSLNIGLERNASRVYCPVMDDISHRPQAPAGWRESLDRSEAQLAAGETVPGEKVMRELYESIARLESKHAGKPNRGTAPRR